jgi:hypothetical protein
MQQFYAENFTGISSFLGAMEIAFMHEAWPESAALGSQNHKEMAMRIDYAISLCSGIGLRLSVKKLQELKADWHSGARGDNWREVVSGAVAAAGWLVRSELEEELFLHVAPVAAEYYRFPLRGWEAVSDRFLCHFDVEEAGKCFAVGRYTASVFHLMRVTESAVLGLQIFLAAPDVKAHFGSVLNKIEHLLQKTKFEALPTHVKQHHGFLSAVLPQLHAVKDSWRNKVSHVDGKILPSDTFTEEMAAGVYGATKLLMQKLEEGLP